MAKILNFSLLLLILIPFHWFHGRYWAICKHQIILILNRPFFLHLFFIPISFTSLIIDICITHSQRPLQEWEWNGENLTCSLYLCAFIYNFDITTTFQKASPLPTVNHACNCSAADVTGRTIHHYFNTFIFLFIFTSYLPLGSWSSIKKGTWLYCFWNSAIPRICSFRR